MKPADWTAESCVTRLLERGRANQELGVFYKLEKELPQKASQGKSEEEGETLRGSGEGVARGSWRFLRRRGSSGSWGERIGSGCLEVAPRRAGLAGARSPGRRHLSEGGSSRGVSTAPMPHAG